MSERFLIPPDNLDLRECFPFDLAYTLGANHSWFESFFATFWLRNLWQVSHILRVLKHAVLLEVREQNKVCINMILLN